MADVELVIKISEKVYNALTHIEFDANLVTDEMRKSIANGKLLPKGHRGIVDLKSVQWAFDDAIVEDAMRTGQVRSTHNEIASILETVPTIIGADTESEV